MLTAGCLILTWIAIEVATNNNKMPEHHWEWAALLAGSAIAMALSAVGWTLAYRRRERSRVAHKLISFLHSRWFPDSAGSGLDSAFRVSLFVPEPNFDAPQRWRCVARTGPVGHKGSHVWKHETDLAKRRWAGLVVNVAQQRAAKTVQGVPVVSRGDQVSLGRYLRDSLLSEEEHDRRSWKYASLLVTFASASNGATMGQVMKMKRYAFPASALSRTRQLHGAVETRLAPSDIPVALEVGHERDGSMLTLLIAFVYPTASGEASIEKRVGSVAASVGQYSRRILRLECRLDSAKIESDAPRVAHELMTALEELRKREQTEGSRMNYETAEAGLELQVSAPPAWMIDAMESGSPPSRRTPSRR